MTNTTSISMNVPLEVASYFRIADETMKNDQKILMMFPYIKNGILSYGRVAEILGINKFELLATYERFGIPYIDISWEEAMEDAQTCMEFMKKKEQSK